MALEMSTHQSEMPTLRCSGQESGLIEVGESVVVVHAVVVAQLNVQAESASGRKRIGMLGDDAHGIDLPSALPKGFLSQKGATKV